MIKNILKYKGVILLYLIVCMFMIIAVNDTNVNNNEGDIKIVINE